MWGTTMSPDMVVEYGAVARPSASRSSNGGMTINIHTVQVRIARELHALFAHQAVVAFMSIPSTIMVDLASH